jgi:hypothetical protein
MMIHHRFSVNATSERPSVTSPPNLARDHTPF